MLSLFPCPSNKCLSSTRNRRTFPVPKSRKNNLADASTISRPVRTIPITSCEKCEAMSADSVNVNQARKEKISLCCVPT
uniref:Ovule protein n=1 Tax=Steinernema glaseri TaxID=37863 RepID=A0A1I7Z0P7_9BILA